MTNDDDLLLLKDPQFLMVLIAAIVKKNGGTLPISVKDVENITTADALGLFKDLDNPEVHIKLQRRIDRFLHTGTLLWGVIFMSKLAPTSVNTLELTTCISIISRDVIFSL